MGIPLTGAKSILNLQNSEGLNSFYVCYEKNYLTNNINNKYLIYLPAKYRKYKVNFKDSYLVLVTYFSSRSSNDGKQ